MSTEQDREAWLRSIRGDKAAAAFNGIPSEETSPPKPEDKAQKAGIYDTFTRKVVAKVRTNDDREVAKSAAQWMGDMMVTKAAPHLGKLPKGTVVSYHTKQEPSVERFGKVVAAATDVQVSEHEASDAGHWEPTGSHHFIFRNQIHGVHEQFPSVEEKSDALNKSIANWLHKR